MSNNPYFVFDGKLCKTEGMSKEQIIAAIAEATGTTPSGLDDAFITKLKEMNRGNNFSFWLGTTAQYNDLATKEQNRLYILTDESFADDIEQAIQESQEAINGLSEDVGTLQNDVGNLQTELDDDIKPVTDTLVTPASGMGDFALVCTKNQTSDPADTQEIGKGVYILMVTAYSDTTFETPVDSASVVMHTNANRSANFEIATNDCRIGIEHISETRKIVHLRDTTDADITGLNYKIFAKQIGTTAGV